MLWLCLRLVVRKSRRLRSFLYEFLLKIFVAHNLYVMTAQPVPMFSSWDPIASTRATGAPSMRTCSSHPQPNHPYAPITHCCPLKLLRPVEP